MNDIETIHQLLADSHADLLPRWQELQLAWLSAQAKKRRETELTQYITGDLSPFEAKEIEAFIATDAKMVQLVAELRTLYAHFLKVDKEEVDTPIARPVPLHLLNRQGIHGWRGEQQMMQLTVQDFYSFDVLLFLLDGTAYRKRSIRGELIGRKQPFDTTPFEGAQVWLIPPYEKKETQVKDKVRNGHFRLRQVPPGTYTLEMAWGAGQFLEVLDIVIPDE